MAVGSTAIHARDLRIARCREGCVAGRLLLSADRFATPGPPGGLAAWDAIPGARGCTPQACSYRDHHAALVQHGAQVFGVSTQDTEYQREVVDRLHLPFELLSDSGLKLARALQLPIFSVAGQTLIKRLTLIGRGGRIEKCFYPVFPPNADAGNVLSYICEAAP